MRIFTYFKLMLLAVILVVGSMKAWGQTTYKWNQAGSAAFGTAANWTPTRTTPAITDILVLNNGATTTVTGVATSTIGGLLVSENTIVNLNSTAAATLTIGNGVSGFDLSVENGSQLNVSQTSAVALIISLATTATGSISGSMNFSSTVAVANQIISKDASGLTFNSGSVFTQGTNNSGNVFGGNTATANSVVFASGSTFIQFAGSNPFVLGQPASVVVFQNGSLFKVTGPNSPSFSGRSYGNLEVNSPGANLTTTGGNAVTMDNLTITAGTLNFNMTAMPGHSIKGNITVAPGATLNFAPGVSATHADGTVNFNGTSLQTISGGGTISSINTFGISTLVVNNPTGVVLDNNITLAGNLTITSGALSINPKKQLTISGTLTNNGRLNLLSDPTGTATILTPNSIGGTSGTVSVQQYLSSARNWYMSSPVSGASSLPSVNAGSLIFYSYPESDVYQVTGGGFAPGAYWNSVSTGTMAVGTGYIVKPSNAASTLTFTGTSLNNNDISVNLSLTSGNPKAGFNLVGNPYSSYLDWTKVSAANSDAIAGMNTSFWYRTQTSDDTYVFDTYNATGPTHTNLGATTVSNLIPPMQGFWVKANSDGADFAITNAMRLHADDATNGFKVPAQINSQQQEIHLTVSNGTYMDETVLTFNPNASNTKDAYDSPKMSNASATIPEIYTLVANEELVINGMNTIPTTEIPLGFRTGESKDFTIKASQISNFDADTHILLKDNLLNVVKDITNGSAYIFSSDVTNSATRFTVLFKTSSTVTGLVNNQEVANAVNVYKNAQNGITINCSNGQGIVSIYNTIGEKMASQALTSTTTVLSKTFTSGVYFVSVVANGKTTTRKIVIN